jgi:hypothetical protein
VEEETQGLRSAMMSRKWWRAQVLHRELALKGDYRALKKISTVHREHDVIAALVDEKGRVQLGLDEAEGGKLGGEATVLGSWRLLEAVQGAVQLAD